MLRTISFILLFLGIYFGLCAFVSVKWALLGFSLLMITLATIFVIKKDFYVKYVTFTNPKYISIYNAKDDDFKRKHRISDITGFYIVSAIMLILSVVMPDVTLPIQEQSILYLVIATIIISMLLWYTSLIIIRKTKKNASFWFYFITSILTGILVLALLQFLLF